MTLADWLALPPLSNTTQAYANLKARNIYLADNPKWIKLSAEGALCLARVDINGEFLGIHAPDSPIDVPGLLGTPGEAIDTDRPLILVFGFNDFICVKNAIGETFQIFGFISEVPEIVTYRPVVFIEPDPLRKGLQSNTRRIFKSLQVNCPQAVRMFASDMIDTKSMRTGALDRVRSLGGSISAIFDSVLSSALVPTTSALAEAVWKAIGRSRTKMDKMDDYCATVGSAKKNAEALAIEFQEVLDNHFVLCPKGIRRTTCGCKAHVTRGEPLRDFVRGVLEFPDLKYDAFIKWMDKTKRVKRHRDRSGIYYIGVLIKQQRSES